MQPDRFTVKSQEAVAAAQALAAERRNSEVTPAHLLVALVRQEDRPVGPVQQKRGPAVDTVPSRAVREVEALPKLAEATEVRPSQAFVNVLRQGGREVAKLGDEGISTAHHPLPLA